MKLMQREQWNPKVPSQGIDQARSEATDAREEEEDFRFLAKTLTTTCCYVKAEAPWKPTSTIEDNLPTISASLNFFNQPQSRSPKDYGILNQASNSII